MSLNHSGCRDYWGNKSEGLVCPLLEFDHSSRIRVVELALGSVYVDLEISGVDQLQRTVSPILFFWGGKSFALALL
jgi:hypothetical protein